MDCLRPKPLTPETLWQIQRDVRLISAPFVDLACDVLALEVPRMILYPDGRCETIHSPECLAQLAEIKLLRKEAVNHYLADRIAF